MNTQTPVNMLPVESDKSAQEWKDKKFYLWLLSPGLPWIGMGGLLAYRMSPKKLRALSWIGPMFVHGVVPLLDKIIGEDHSNAPDEMIADLEKRPYYSRLVKAFIPGQLLLNLYAGYIATRKETPLLDKIGLTVSMGMVNGIAFVTGHELSHQQAKLDRLLSMVTLAPTGYGHFAVEHPMGHHRRVSTPEDPASSKMGESFWQFLPRTVIGSFKSAIEIETRRLKRRGKTFWDVDNELLQSWAMSAVFHGIMLKVFGKKAIPFLVGQAIYGIALFEVINYIEHYGLLRQKKPDGNYERTMPEHSWNSNNVVTNLFLYQLQRHSDHHAYPTRHFQALRHFENTPQLPSGYASMLLPAYFPSIWFKMMDKRVLAHYDGDLNKANILPSRRAAIFKKFGLTDKSAK